METEGRVGWMGAKLPGPANHTPSSLAITSPNAPPGSQAPLWNVLDLFLTLGFLFTLRSSVDQPSLNPLDEDLSSPPHTPPVVMPRRTRRTVA